MDNRVRLSSVVTVLAGCLVMGVSPVWAQPDHEIHPTGDPSIDLPAIQAAVDAGGVIQLGAGTFNLGDDGRVNITNSVALIGEGDQATVIFGGDQPFYLSDGYDVVFEDLWFRESYFASIGVHDVSGDVMVKDCTFTSVRPMPYFGQWSLAAGVYVQGNDIGDLTVEDSFFDILDNASFEDWIFISGPIWFYQVFPAFVGGEMSLEVRDNVFVHHDSEKAVALWPVAGVNARIADNLFRKEPSNHNVNYLHHAVHAANVGGAGSLKLEVVDNDFEGLAVPVFARGYTELVLEDNEAELVPWKYAHLWNRSAALYLVSADNLIARNNEIRGEAASAFQIGGIEGEESAHNVIIENDIEELCATYGSVWMEAVTHDNTYEGSCADGVLDEGVDNEIICDDGYVGEPCIPSPRIGAPNILPVSSSHMRVSRTVLDEFGYGLTAFADPGGEGQRSLTPSTTRLLAVSPSPFRGNVAVRYELASAGQVSLRVFNVSGRVIRQLVNTSQTAGNHEVAWDGRAEDGSRAAPGVYFVDLQADGHPRLNQRIVRLE